MTERTMHPEEPPIEGLEAWAQEPVPAQTLEVSVFEALRSEGLVGSPSRWSWIPLAAMLMAAVGVGILVGHLWGGGAADPGTGAQRQHFLLLLFEDDTYRSPAPDELVERVAEYAAWAGEDHGDVQVVGGEKLADGAVVVPGLQERGSVGGRRLAGFFELEADSVDAARLVAMSCPHLRYGGTIEVRAIEATP